MNNQMIVNGENQTGLNANALKFIAIIAMSIDHLTWTFMPFQNGVLLGYTSVIWSLMWGLIALAAVKSENPKMTPVVKVLAVIACCMISLPADWSAAATLAIVFVGINRGNFKKQMLGIFVPVALYATGYALFFDKTYGLVQLAVILSFPFLYAYNGKLGKWKGMKWFFYLYYPLHMTILGLIRIYYLR